MSEQLAKEIDYLKRKIERERKAREEAEHLLELKSLDLYQVNKQLTESIQNLDIVVSSRTEELKAAQEDAESANLNLKDSLKRLELIIQASGAATWGWNIEDNTFYCSDALEEILGEETDINSYDDFLRLVHSDDLDTVKDAFFNHVSSQEDPIDLYCRLLHSSIGYRWFHLIGQLSYTTDRPHVVGSFADVHERLESDKIIEKMAHSDGLTNIPNRTLFSSYFKKIITEARAHSLTFSLCIIDLNDFKGMNDRYGHQAGDALLIRAASTLKKYISEDDFVARLGGDEFAVIFSNNKSEEQKGLTDFCSKVIDECRLPTDIDGVQLAINLSIGIARYPKDGTTIERLLRCADMAMYAAKKQKVNGSNFVSFQEGIDVEYTRKRELRDKIEEALEQNQFYLEFQPCVEVSTGISHSCEALLRWPHKPSHFTIQDVINVAEETGLILKLSEVITDMACTFIAELESANFNHRVGVNLSAIQFQYQDILTMLKAAIERHGISSNHLQVEVTENLFLGNMDKPVAILQALSDDGIQIYIDDFGTGYSSLQYLQILPAHWIKIDKSFIDDIEQDNVNLRIIEAVIRMAHLMNRRVVAEGVETEKQYQLLSDINCDVIQGYYFSRPLPKEAYVEWLSKNGK